MVSQAKKNQSFAERDLGVLCPLDPLEPVAIPTFSWVAREREINVTYPQLSK
jgi:hypothetical protein